MQNKFARKYRAGAIPLLFLYGCLLVLPALVAYIELVLPSAYIFGIEKKGVYLLILAIWAFVASISLKYLDCPACRRAASGRFWLVDQCERCGQDLTEP